MFQFRARVPWGFFEELYPFNAELLDGDAMIVKACAAKPSNGAARDGGILRSREYLLFGHGIATILPHARRYWWQRDECVMEVTEKCDPRGVRYWEFQCASDLLPGIPDWRLKISHSPPDPDEEGHVRRLIEISGKPGQYFYLAAIA